MLERAGAYGRDMIERIVQALDGLEYGSVHITVHDAQITQIDRIEKQRFSLGPSSTKESSPRRRPTAL
ncbi:YezD family protein [Alicyclobacillus acidiphilus]|uniref:YezD family protein n=1 Tax=Alicyclobacillus acidiphilus TaxID=182455 RepID=UPI000830D0AA|nr:YezD family protein [Alicyclobacillus acidiphilus]